MTNAPSGEWVTSTEAASILGRTRWTVARLVLRGELTPRQTTPLGHLFARADVEALAARRSTEVAS